MNLLRQIVLCVVLAVVIPVGVVHAAQKKNYSFETDPIRVGTKALQEQRYDQARASFDEAVANEYKVPEAKLGLAEVTYALGHYKEAETFAREAIEAQQKYGESPRFAEAHARLGLILIQMDRWDDATTEIQLANKQKQGLWLGNYGLARLYMRDQKWEEAKKLIDRGKNKKLAFEGEDLYHHALAMYLLGTNDVKGAEVEALYAFNMSPTNPEFGELLGRIYEVRNVPALAIDAYENMLRNPQVVPTAQFIHRLGRLYEENRRYNEARDRYLKAVEIDSTYLPPVRDLGHLLFIGQQYDNAAKVYLRYVTLEPNDIDVRMRLAESLTELGFVVQALPHAVTALDLDSSRVDVRFTFARTAIRSQDPAAQGRAVWVYASLPDSVTWKPKDHVLVATYQIDSGDLNAGRWNLSQALAADSAYAEAYYQLGLLAMKDSKSDSAILAFEKAARYDAQKPYYFLNLGIAHSQAADALAKGSAEKTRELEKALQAFRQAVAVDPRLTLGYVLQGQTLSTLNFPSEAEAAYRKALEIDPENANALRSVGYMQLQAGNFSGAAQSYEHSTRAEPGNARGWVGLAQALLGLKDVNGAQRALDKARAIEPGNSEVKRIQELINRAKG